MKISRSFEMTLSSLYQSYKFGSSAEVDFEVAQDLHDERGVSAITDEEKAAAITKAG